MYANDACIIYFSPTHTSKRVAEAIAEGIAAEQVTTIDLTRDMPKETLLQALTVIAVPVYTGHIPPVALRRMERLKGKHTPVVLVVVYGNRAYEQALVELDQYAEAHGFYTIAAATFVGEHSYSTRKHPIAQGRPNLEDLEQARNFGREIRKKVEETADSEHLYGIDVRRIPRPKQPFFPLFRFLRKVMKIRKSGIKPARSPWLPDKRKCVHCGTCAEQCPTQAITPGDETYTDVERCIRCCACVKCCPQEARIYETPLAEALADCFKRQKQPQTLL